MKKRIDELLVSKNLFSSREKAKNHILLGDVFVNNQKVYKPSEMYLETDTIDLKIKDRTYVSRGALKLKKAFEIFKFEIKDKIAIDIGSSTGGFTDFLLQNNVKKVYAVDVGTNQLDWSIRSNPNVVTLENTNFRDIDATLFKEKIDLFVCDVSFISLSHIFPSISRLMDFDAQAIVLIKPQFEVGREDATKGKGLIKDKNKHIEVIKKIIKLAEDNELYVNDLDFSPIKGNKMANIEFLALVSKTPKNISIDKINSIVNLAHK